jgi:hypothetical protein
MAEIWAGVHPRLVYLRTQFWSQPCHRRTYADGVDLAVFGRVAELALRVVPLAEELTARRVHNDLASA